VGCDIHLYVEVRKNGKWEQAGQMVKNEYYSEGDQDASDPESKPMVRERFWRGRNYSLFGVLAGVRTSFPPIAKPRGIPRDASKEVKMISKRWDGDGHTHSWLDLAELFDFAYGKGYGMKDKNRFEDIDRYFAEVTMPKLINLAAEPGLKPEDVRIVFFFDN
jgi:hypothetical protein